MATSKTYYNDKDDDSPHLTIHRNTEGNLFVCLSPFESHSSDVFLELPPEDARKIIIELAREFDMLDETTVEGNVLFIL